MAGIGSAVGKRPDEEEAMEQAAPEVEQEDVAAEPQGNGVGQAMQSGGEPNASPEEQAEYDQIMSNALKIIYPEGGEEPSQQVLQALSGSQNPVINLANTAVVVIRGLRDSAEKSGEVQRWNEQAQQGDMLDFDGILYHVGEAVTNELAELAEAAKIHDYSEDEAEKAFLVGLDMYREQAKESGQIDEQGLNEGWSQLQQAEQEGRIDQVLPGASRKAGKMAPATEEQA